ncbi:MAG: homocysteine S-methyltransferase family protein [Candidatus Edwardsbacteria bacterium]|nr:homocysteine S-methyltransferase family protein [Candidatus Edwardsbacteria bacterium]
MRTDLATYLTENRTRILVCDGGMGSCLLRAGLSDQDYGGHPGCHEFLNIMRPDVISQIHRDYFAAGARMVETNSFGGAAHILAEHGLADRCVEINRAAAALARTVADDFPRSAAPCFVAGSIGPGSKLPSLGQISFDELFAGYTAQAQGLLEGGVDCFICETSQDLLQLKAAIIAVRDVRKTAGVDIPIIAQVTIDRTGRTLTGSDIATVLGTLEPLPVMAIGLNCGMGPDGMSEAIHYLAAHSTKLVSVMPNAGLPKLVNGRAVYSLKAEHFAGQMLRYAQHPGLNIAGGCCGTTPEHISALAEALKCIPARKPARSRKPCLTSLFQAQEIDVSPKPLILGERTNASGSRAFKELLLRDDFGGMAAMALEQEREGAHAVDLSLAAAGRDEEADFCRFAAMLNQRLRAPVMVDSTDPAAVEAALKRLAGRCAVNSVHLEGGEDKAKRIIDLCMRHGAALVCLAIDERGMALTADRKVEVAARLHGLAQAGGLAEGDLFFDLLTFTLASGEQSLRGSAAETLRAIGEVKKLFPRAFTSLGVSNVSYGLPPAARPYLNSIFLHHAVARGLDAAIIHAGKIRPLHAIPPVVAAMCDDLVLNRTPQGRPPLERLLEYFSRKDGMGERQQRAVPIPANKRLTRQVVEGNADSLDMLIAELLKKHDATAIIQTMLLPGMDEVGRLFSRGQLQLPFVLRSAEVVKQAMALLAPQLKKHRVAARGTIVLATVRGDIHDIGKNLVDMILTANGYKVVNLGIRQSAEDILLAARRDKPDVIGLSGLLVESVKAMAEYLEIFAESGLDIPVICGGAALSKKYLDARMKPIYPAGVHYAKDAMAGLKILNEIIARDRTAANDRKRKPTIRGVQKPRERAKAPARASRKATVPTRIVAKVPVAGLYRNLDKVALLERRWKLGKLSQKQRLEAETRLAGLWRILRPMIRPKAVYAMVPADDRRFDFKTNILKHQAQYGIQLVTLGADLGKTKPLTAEDQFLLHGLAAELTEALAKWCDMRLARENGWKRTRRISPGYPVWPELSEQKKIFALLKPGRIGVRLSEGFQMIPEYSTSAAVLPR